MFDLFLAPLTCRNCGQASPDGFGNQCQTYLHADGSRLRVGSVLDGVEFTEEWMGGVNYLLLNEPVDGEPILLLETWDCSFCGQRQLWALIEIQDQTIARMEAAELTRELVHRAHFISTECYDDVAILISAPPDQNMYELDLVALLKKHLTK